MSPTPDRVETVAQYFKSSVVIHGALVAGPVSFALVSIFLNSSKEIPPGQDITVFLALVMVLGAGCAMASIILFRNQLNAAREKSSLQDKLLYYRSALVVAYALLEGPALLSVVQYFVTGNYIFLAIAGAFIVLLALKRPTKFKAVMDLNLNPAERKLIENPNTILSEL